MLRFPVSQALQGHIVWLLWLVVRQQLLGTIYTVRTKVLCLSGFRRRQGFLRAWASRPSFTAMLFQSGEGCLSVATTPAEAEAAATAAAAAQLRLCVRRQRLLKKI